MSSRSPHDGDRPSGGPDSSSGPSSSASTGRVPRSTSDFSQPTPLTTSRRSVPFYTALKDGSGGLTAERPESLFRARAETAPGAAGRDDGLGLAADSIQFDLPGRVVTKARTSPAATLVNSVPRTEGRPSSVAAAEAGISSGGLRATHATSTAATPASTRPSYTAPLSPPVEARGVESGQPLDAHVFLSEVLFVWMGSARTNHATYNSVAQRYELEAACASARQRSAFQLLQENGVVARRVDEALRRSTAESSFLQQSLRTALRRQLTQYHYLVTSLRQQCGEGGLALADLVVTYHRVHPKLWMMHRVLEETESVKGGELASKLQLLVHEGSHRLSSLLNDIYLEAVTPLLRMTAEAMIKGDVADPFDEFFIAANEGVGDMSETLWADRFVLRPSMLPSTVPLAVAEDVLLVTKNVYFIRHACRARQWRMNAVLVAELQHATFEALPGVVRRAVAHTNEAVLRLIYEEFKLNDVFRMINAFLLVGYGDFYEILIQKLTPILSKMSHHVQTSQVRDELQSALMEVTPYARRLDTDRFAALQCEVVKDEAKLGWDAFIMTMPVPAPLNNVFDAGAMKVYRRLFRMLFKVKGVEVALKYAWRQSVRLDRVIGGMQQRGSKEMGAWKDVSADAHLLGLQLNHFVSNLWSYLVAEVCMVSWDLLQKALKRCQSLDDVRDAHQAYLTYLTQRSLLRSDCASIRMNIENVLTVCREYCASEALLASLVERGAGEVHVIKQQYGTLTDDFQREISSLLSTLEEQHLHFDFLNFLLLRLNFNHFYYDANSAQNTDF